MIKRFFDHKIWVILLATIAVVMLVLIAAGLGDLHFQPGRPLAMSETTTIQVSMEKVVQEIIDIPFWKQLVFWGLVFLLVLIFASLLSPEMRKRLIRYFLRLALFGLVIFYIAKNYRELFPGLTLGGAVGAEIGAPTGVETAPAVFTPPQVSSTLLYLISLVVVLVLATIVFLAGRWWQRKQRLQRDAQPLEDLAEIARTSLADISSGRSWEDVVIRCYTRMNEVVGSQRGLHRRKDFTASEFAARLEGAGLPGEAVRRLTRLFEAARYGARQSSREEMAEALACLNSVLYACGVNK